MKMRILNITLVAFFLLAGFSCKSGSSNMTSTPPATVPGGPITGTVINSDSLITANIQAIRPQTTGYPWEVDVLILTSNDVSNLPNPTRDSVGKVVTVKTDQDMTMYKVGDAITARVKNVGDVPKPGITLYMYSINLTPAM